MSARLSAVRTTACSSQTKVKSILVVGEPMDRQVGVCWPSGEVQDLGLWPLRPLWAVGFMVSIWVFWGMPSFASFPVPFEAGFHRNESRYQRLLCTVVSKGALGLISLGLESGGADWPVAIVDSASTPSLRGIVT